MESGPFVTCSQPRYGGSLHADAIMDRIVHNSITIESGNVNMRERVHKNNK